jgi:hypothetical protein
MKLRDIPPPAKPPSSWPERTCKLESAGRKRRHRTRSRFWTWIALRPGRPGNAGASWVDELPPNNRSASDPAWKLVIAWVLLPFDLLINAARLLCALLRALISDQ